MSQLHIDSVHAKGLFYPMLVKFQNGYNTDQLNLTDCEVFEDIKNGRKTLAGELDGLLYAGDEIQEELGKTMILARNKVTGKVRLIEVGCVEMKPILKFDKDKPDRLETSNLELSRKFGSKKQKQQMEHREKLKVNVETVTKQMQSVTENLSADKLDLSLYNKSDSDDFYIPPIDRNASQAQEVYDIEKILSEEQFDKIYSEIEEKDYISDLNSCLKNIIESKKCSTKQTVLAVYANSLIKIYTTMGKDIAKKSYTACPHSGTLNEIILANFTSMTNGRRSRPTPYKDKSLCHAIVFMLLINNLKFELDSLCQCIKITPNTVATKVRVTGASIVTTGNKKYAQLKLPLNTKAGFRRKSAKF